VQVEQREPGQQEQREPEQGTGDRAGEQTEPEVHHDRDDGDAGRDHPRVGQVGAEGAPERADDDADHGGEQYGQHGPNGNEARSEPR
jgi:hypothetical protein